MPHTIKVTLSSQYDNFVFGITLLGDLQHILIVLKSLMVETCVFNSVSLSSLTPKLFLLQSALLRVQGNAELMGTGNFKKQ